MATETERRLFASKVLTAVGREPSSLRGERRKLSGFMAMAGSLYAGDLMVVGRACNGWGAEDEMGFMPEELASDAAAERYSHKVLDSVNRGSGDEKCPMRWVTDKWGNTTVGYNTKTSAFWRVIRCVVERLGIADIERASWPSHLVWSNLYKIAPCQGGNPNDSLCDIQFPGCRELFTLELTTYTPSRLLLLTGTAWARDFLNDFGESLQDANGFSYVERCGTLAIGSKYHPVRYIVAAHPEGKREDQWVEEVCSAFNRQPPIADNRAPRSG